MKTAVIAEAEMPDTGHRLEGLIAAMSEAIAETDEGLFEKFFSGEQFTRDEILHGIHSGCEERFHCAGILRLGCDHGRHRYAAGRYGGPPAVPPMRAPVWLLKTKPVIRWMFPAPMKRPWQFWYSRP